jgi:heterodisulfide reductase subunit C
MVALLIMNAAEEAYLKNSAPFFFSNILAQGLTGISPENLYTIEKTAWWVHFIGILAFLNYLPYSKHFHIILAFPNTWYSKLTKQGAINPMAAVTNEIKAMMDTSFVPDISNNPKHFGAKDISDLHFANLLNAYTCTECGRCTDECPANQTGKLLSPRKIMISTRTRVEELIKNPENELSLLDNHITREELWACTTCNACVEACPLNIDPLDIIIQMRQYLVMEESSAPQSINAMNTNIENNGAPWAYSQADRGMWTKED